MTRRTEKIVLPALFAAITALALIMYGLRKSTSLEAFSVITGAMCVWLTVKESVWNFPISLVNVVAFGVVFFKARLFADAGLQVIFFVLTVQGWYLWLYGGREKSRLEITRSPMMEGSIVALCGVVVSVMLMLYLRHIGGASPAWDAITTALSLAAQYLLNQKRLENWFCWIAADLIYIPLYAYKELWLTALLYSVFLCMAIIGLIHWRANLRQARGFEPIMEGVAT